MSQPNINQPVPTDLMSLRLYVAGLPTPNQKVDALRGFVQALENAHNNENLGGHSSALILQAINLLRSDVNKWIIDVGETLELPHHLGPKNHAEMNSFINGLPTAVEKMGAKYL